MEKQYSVKNNDVNITRQSLVAVQSVSLGNKKQQTGDILSNREDLFT